MGVNVTKIHFIKLKQIEKELGTLVAMKELQTFKDGFSYSNSVIIRKSGKDDIDAVSAHWEFIPVWVKTIDEIKVARKQGIPWLNATSEKLLESKMFKSAALKTRCLVLCSYFFEWRHYKPEGAKKDISYPYVIGLNNMDYFYMAGIWQPWTDRETGETFDTFAIVTTKANQLMQKVHNTKERMPTILNEDLAYEWIMDDLSEERIKEIATYQFPSEDMFAYTIPREYKFLDNPCEEFEYNELPGLDITL